MRRHDFFHINTHIYTFKFFFIISEQTLQFIKIDGAIKRISSAYNTINDLGVSEPVVGTASKYIANKKGGRTEHCLTPNLWQK